MVKIGNLEVAVFKGDILKLNVECIVNAANSLMVMGGGVAGVIKRHGGEEIEKEARKKAPVPVGEAVSTTAGKLKFKFVIHAPTMPRPAMSIPPENVYLAAKAALVEAEKTSCESIALPALGAGVGGVPMNKVAKLIVKAIIEHSKRAVKVKKVILCGLNQKTVEEFKKALFKYVQV